MSFEASSIRFTRRCVMMNQLVTLPSLTLPAIVTAAGERALHREHPKADYAGRSLREMRGEGHKADQEIAVVLSTRGATSMVSTPRHLIGCLAEEDAQRLSESLHAHRTALRGRAIELSSKLPQRRVRRRRTFASRCRYSHLQGLNDSSAAAAARSNSSSSIGFAPRSPDTTLRAQST
jgi:hypothetical protein